MKTIRRLELTRETIRVLTDQELEGVYAGGGPTGQNPSNAPCNSHSDTDPPSTIDPNTNNPSDVC